MSDDFPKRDPLPGHPSSLRLSCDSQKNGCIEPFFRTLKEQLLWIRHFRDLEELRLALMSSGPGTTTNGFSNA
jgi:hypothetical protein